MLIKTFVYYLILVLSLCSICGYGILFFNEKKIEIEEENIFNYFFKGLIIITILSIVYYFLIPNNKIINFTIFLIGILIYFKNLKFKNVNFISFLSLIFFSGLLISKTHEDFSIYHFQHIKELTDGYIKFGMANLDIRYFYSSIFAYTQAIFRFPYFDLKLINLPVYSIYISLIGYLILEINKSKNKIQFFHILFLLLLIFKFKRMSEFGYDYIGQFILVYIFLEYIYKNNKGNEFKSKVESVIFFLYTLLLKISNIYFLPIIIYKIINKELNIKQLLLNNKLIIFSIIFLFSFTLNSFTKTGCLNYFIEFTCLSKNKYSWAIDYQSVEETKKLSKLWARGFYHQKKINLLSEQDYNKNLKWINNWYQIHFLPKIFPYIIILALIYLVVKFFIGESKKNIIQNLKIIYFLLFSNLIWLYFFPQFRFGVAGISLLFFLIFSKFLKIPKSYNYKKLLSICIIGLIYFNFSNFIRINKEFHREDIYKFVNFPFFVLPKLNFDEYSQDKIKYNRSSENDNFWRTCFNSDYICVNHDDEIEFKSKGRILFINKKN